MAATRERVRASREGGRERGEGEGAYEDDAEDVLADDVDGAEALRH